MSRLNTAVFCGALILKRRAGVLHVKMGMNTVHVSSICNIFFTLELNVLLLCLPISSWFKAIGSIDLYTS